MVLVKVVQVVSRVVVQVVSRVVQVVSRVVVQVVSRVVQCAQFSMRAHI